jgi:hypothetical protein
MVFETQKHGEMDSHGHGVDVLDRAWTIKKVVGRFDLIHEG